MVSKRQREARKKFREEHPELVPKPEPTPLDLDPKMMKKRMKKKKDKERKKFKLERKKSDAFKAQNQPRNNKFTKKPLRVPGMKPGDSCFICHAKDHISKLCPERAGWERDKICLLCRRRGHSLKNCPNPGAKMDKKICYNCGETGHPLSNCPYPLTDGGSKFAECFICHEIGHLSKNCPQNTHGIYPKGGSCKICDGVTHLAKDCPNKGNRVSSATGTSARTFEDRPRARLTKFYSGDDLEDDFTMGETDKGAKDKSSAPKVRPTADIRDINIKTKKHEPKIVNFF